jgi:prepilin-type processing-associated H-X9-DG protein
MFPWVQGVAMSDVSDGTSNTILLGERLIATQDTSATPHLQDQVLLAAQPTNTFSYPSQSDVLVWGQAGMALWTDKNTANGTPGVFTGGCFSNTWATGDVWVNECAPPNWQYPNVSAAGCHWTGVAGWGINPPRSAHPGGVNVAMADASVQFVTNTVDQTAWQYLGSRNDGNPIAIQ